MALRKELLTVSRIREGWDGVPQPHGEAPGLVRMQEKEESMGKSLSLL